MHCVSLSNKESILTARAKKFGQENEDLLPVSGWDDVFTFFAIFGVHIRCTDYLKEDS